MQRAPNDQSLQDDRLPNRTFLNDSDTSQSLNFSFPRNARCKENQFSDSRQALFGGILIKYIDISTQCTYASISLEDTPSDFQAI